MASSMEECVEKHIFNGQLYNALMREDEKTVILLCQIAQERALRILTTHNDTVLHVAARSKQGDLVSKLLGLLPPNISTGITCQNHFKNTILHEVAVSKQSINTVSILLEKAPALLHMRNHLGETALFRAAAYGNTAMFNYLIRMEIIDLVPTTQIAQLLSRSDKATVLHISILNQHFDLALEIARTHSYLIGEKDMNGMTALQLLSCNPYAFKREIDDGFLKRLINSVKLHYSSVKWEAIEQEKQRYHSALTLAKFLVWKDISWEATNDGIAQTKPNPHESDLDPVVLSKEREDGNESSTNFIGQGGGEGNTPLFLATKSGCIEIVQEILKSYPQAVEHIDDNGQNILHTTIKYRRSRIFKLLTEMELPMTRLVQHIDKEGNSILHMAGIKMKHYVPGKMVADPAAELGQELSWFERVKKVTPIHFINHQNHMKQTADELFASTNSELCDLAKEWLKRASEGCSIIAVLIATVAFAAAYTIPGGPNQITGLPILLYKPLFVIFIVTDVLSVTLALKALLSFLSILTSPFHIEDFKQPLPRKFALAVTCLFHSVSMMMLAFAATISLMIHNKERWIKIALSAATFLPIGIVARSHFCIYYTSLSRVFKYVLKKATWASCWSKSDQVLKWWASCWSKSDRVPLKKTTSSASWNATSSFRSEFPTESQQTSDCPAIAGFSI